MLKKTQNCLNYKNASNWLMIKMLETNKASNVLPKMEFEETRFQHGESAKLKNMFGISSKTAYIVSIALEVN